MTHARGETSSDWIAARLPTKFFAVAALSLLALGFLGLRQIEAISEANSAIRVERAGRAASALVASTFESVEIITDEGGAPSLIIIDPSLIRSGQDWDDLLDRIASVNQGAANLFQYAPEANTFDRLSTTFRTDDGERVGGSEVEHGLIAEGHPAFETIISGEVFTGEVPVNGRLRLAYLTPIKSEIDGDVTGLFAVDVGWVDEVETAKARSSSTVLAVAVAVLIGLSLVAVSLVFWSLRPLTQLSELAHALGSDRDFEQATFELAARDDEIGYLAKGLAKVADLQASLEHQAYFDSLTNIPNRVAFLDALDERIEASSDDSPPFALLIADLDGFKQVNDGLGHQAGDELLVAVAGAMQEALREGELLARLGGDEFGILSPNHADAEAAAVELAERLIAIASTTQMTSAGKARVAMSVGVAIVPRDATDRKQALTRADLALYEAKRSQRGTCQVYEPRLSRLVERHALLLPELRSAVERGEIEVVYQPLYNAAGWVDSVEALARWTHPTQGPIPPEEFIPLAERSGLIVALGDHVLNTACQQLEEWAATSHPRRSISINVSTIQLRRTDFAPKLEALLDRYPAANDHLTVELAESSMVSDGTVRHESVLRRLRELGVGISIDDFGTGYSSLVYLHDLDVDQVKVERNFVAAAVGDPHQAQLFAGIVGMGKALGLKVVVEGIEQPEHLDLVHAHDVDCLQGFLLGRPMSATDVAKSFTTPHPRLTQSPDRRGRNADNLVKAVDD